MTLKKKWIIGTVIISVFLTGGLTARYYFKVNAGKLSEQKADQKRIAQYIVDNFQLRNGDLIEQIEFVEFQKNNMTGTWRITAIINNQYDISISEDNIGDDNLGSNYLPTEFKDISENPNQNMTTFKIIYYEE